MFRIFLISLFTITCFLSPDTASSQHKKVLIFYKTAGFKHNSIAEGKAAIEKLAQANNFKADTTSDANKINKKNLKSYAAVVFLNTTGDVFNEEQQVAFQDYIASGGGFVGIHAATDTEYDWPWFGKLSGAYFESHPSVQTASLKVVDPSTIATKHLPEIWKVKDEWYNFKQLSPDLNVLLVLDESSYKGGKNGANHPIAWYHNFEGGRAFYTGLGHTEESYTDQLFLDHLLGGLLYAMGIKPIKG